MFGVAYASDTLSPLHCTPTVPPVEPCETTGWAVVLVVVDEVVDDVVVDDVADGVVVLVVVLDGGTTELVEGELGVVVADVPSAPGTDDWGVAAARPVGVVARAITVDDVDPPTVPVVSEPSTTGSRAPGAAVVAAWAVSPVREPALASPLVCTDCGREAAAGDDTPRTANRTAPDTSAAATIVATSHMAGARKRRRCTGWFSPSQPRSHRKCGTNSIRAASRSVFAGTVRPWPSSP